MRTKLFLLVSAVVMLALGVSSGVAAMVRSYVTQNQQLSQEVIQLTLANVDEQSSLSTGLQTLAMSPDITTASDTPNRLSSAADDAAGLSCLAQTMLLQQEVSQLALANVDEQSSLSTGLQILATSADTTTTSDPSNQLSSADDAAGLSCTAQTTQPQQEANQLALANAGQQTRLSTGLRILTVYDDALLLSSVQVTSGSATDSAAAPVVDTTPDPVNQSTDSAAAPVVDTTTDPVNQSTDSAAAPVVDTTPDPVNQSTDSATVPVVNTTTDSVDGHVASSVKHTRSLPQWDPAYEILMGGGGGDAKQALTINFQLLSPQSGEPVMSATPVSLTIVRVSDRDVVGFQVVPFDSATTSYHFDLALSHLPAGDYDLYLGLASTGQVQVLRVSIPGVGK